MEVAAAPAATEEGAWCRARAWNIFLPAYLLFCCPGSASLLLRFSVALLLCTHTHTRTHTHTKYNITP